MPLTLGTDRPLAHPTLVYPVTGYRLSSSHLVVTVADVLSERTTACPAAVPT
jgi:hypothetical protein